MNCACSGLTELPVIGSTSNRLLARHFLPKKKMRKGKGKKATKMKPRVDNAQEPPMSLKAGIMQRGMTPAKARREYATIVRAERIP